MPHSHRLLTRRRQAYTCRDTPEIVRRIERDLDHVTETVREHDPALRALVLTGGFARGEGAVRDGAPQNDYDLVALRGRGRPDRPYEELRRALEADIDLHLDLAPVPVWRLPWARASIFWYETALRGRTLHGEALLDRIPVRRAEDIRRDEPLRLLANRAAGLLLATGMDDADEIRIQSAKAILGAADAHLLAHGAFPPSQTERWHLYCTLRAADNAPAGIASFESALAWAYRYKIDPVATPPVEPDSAWRWARQSLLDAIPTALRFARHRSLKGYARSDGLSDHLAWILRARTVPGARRWMWQPSGKVRLATLRLLSSSPEREIRPEAARLAFDGLPGSELPPLERLERLRAATLQ